MFAPRLFFIQRLCVDLLLHIYFPFSVWLRIRWRDRRRAAKANTHNVKSHVGPVGSEIPGFFWLTSQDGGVMKF